MADADSEHKQGRPLFRKSETILLGIVIAGVVTVILDLRIAGTACFQTETCSPFETTLLVIGFLAAIGSIPGYIMYVEEAKRNAKRKPPDER